MKKKQYEKICVVCGTAFIADHGNKRMCSECREVIYHNRNRQLPRSYDAPKNTEAYEHDLRERNVRRFRDTIIAIGYADRQRAQTLKMVGKVKVTL